MKQASNDSGEFSLNLGDPQFESWSRDIREFNKKKYIDGSSSIGRINDSLVVPQ